MQLVVHPLTPDRWADLEAVFEARGCSVARGCWCMYYRVRGKGAYTRPGDEQRVRSKAALAALAAADPPPGLLGYLGPTPVGWISLGPRQDYAKLANSPAMKPVDDQPVWSIVCFVVPSEYRRQGVAGALLARRRRLCAPARRAAAGGLSGGQGAAVGQRRALVRLEAPVRRRGLRGGGPAQAGAAGGAPEARRRLARDYFTSSASIGSRSLPVRLPAAWRSFNCETRYW